MKKGIYFILLIVVMFTMGCELEKPSVLQASHPSGIVARDTGITLSTTIDGADICYTIDGTDPTAGSTLYLASIPITKNTTIKAVVVQSGQVASEVFSFEYLVKAEKPTTDKIPGTYDSSQTVTLSCANPGVDIYYTTNGSRPTTSSTKYTEPIEVSKNTTIMAMAVSDDYYNSDTSLFQYGIKTPLPTSSLVEGTYDVEKSASLSCSAPQTMIFYTLDGKTPTSSSTPYSSELSFSSVVPNKVTLKFIAIADGYEPSDVVSCNYIFYTPGPSGGFIFYDCDADNSLTNNGAGPDGLKSSVCGWRYLEVSPEDIEVSGVTTFVFGYYRTSYNGANLLVNGTTTYEEGTPDPNDRKCTGKAIGTGKANTIKLVNKMGNDTYSSSLGADKTPNYAAKLCNDYSFGGYDDWFLPSSKELAVIVEKVQGCGLGSLSSDHYWSSSESDETWGLMDYSWCTGRGGKHRVRAVRAFLEI